MARTLLSLDEDDAAGGAPKGPPAWLFPALFAAAAIQAALFVYVLVANLVLKPYSDAYAFLFDAFEQRDGRLGFLAYLWHPHVGHHMVWVRLLTAWEVAQVGGTWPTVLAATLALVASAALLGWMAWRTEGVAALRLPAALAGAMLMLTGFNALDADQPINALYPFCLVFALASLFLFEGGARDVRGETVRRILALFLAMAAALGNGVGLAIWPVLALAAVTSPRRRWLWTGVVLVVGGLFSFAYLAGPGELAQLTAPPSGDDGAGRRVIYFLDYLAMPWSRLSALGGAALGVGLIALSAWLVNLARRRGLTASDRMALGLLVFAFGTAFLAAAGRGGVNDGFPALRYAVFLVPLQTALIMLAAPMVERRLGGGPLLTGLVAVLFAALLAQQVGSVRMTARATDRIRTTIAAYETGSRGGDVVPLIYPELPFADRVEARLKREQTFGKAPAELARGHAAAAPAPVPSAGGRTP